MNPVKVYAPPKKVAQELTITRWSNGEVTFDFVGLTRWSEVHTLHRLCEREVRHRLAKGELLSEKGDENAEK